MKGLLGFRKEEEVGEKEERNLYIACEVKLSSSPSELKPTNICFSWLKLILKNWKWLILVAHDGIGNWNYDDISHAHSWYDGLVKMVMMTMTYASSMNIVENY